MAQNSPLAGLLVVSLEQAVAAPVCSARLRDAGARVIKIERSVGDFARAYDTAACGESSYFTWNNQGKESLVLDIKDEHDQRLLHNILAKADVFIQNLAPGALEKLSLDSASLRALYPRLITCDISGYGGSAEVKHLKAYDLLVQAETGLVSISGGPGEPGRIGISLCDIGTGVTAHAAILEALIQRGITGKGSAVAVSLFDVAAEWMTVPFIHSRYGDGAPTRQGLFHPSISPYGTYRTRDGVDTLVAIQNEREWVRFCESVLLDSSVAQAPEFRTNAERVKNRARLDELIMQSIGEIDASDFRARLADGAIAFGALNSVEDLVEHIALRTRESKTSSGQTLQIPAHPFKHHDSDTGRTPTIGEHTEQIRQEFS